MFHCRYCKIKQIIGDTHSIVKAECGLHFTVCDVLILSKNLEVIVNDLVAKFENLLKVLNLA